MSASRHTYGVFWITRSCECELEVEVLCYNSQQVPAVYGSLKAAQEYCDYMLNSFGNRNEYKVIQLR